MSERCPTCGSPVTVVSDQDELGGIATCHYEPSQPAVTPDAFVALETERDALQAEVARLWGGIMMLLGPLGSQGGSPCSCEGCECEIGLAVDQIADLLGLPHDQQTLMDAYLEYCSIVADGR